MSAKNLDLQGRWRNKTVAFRVSPEEDEMIEAKVKISGLTKQDYIISRLLDNEIVVHGNPRVFKALKGQMTSILLELQQLTDGTEVSDDLIELMAFITQTMKGLKDEE